MPESLFRDAMLDAPEGFEGIEMLAGKCRTSITATAIRYASFAEHPVAVLVSSGTTISYCFMSERFRELVGRGWIGKGQRLHSGSATAKFNLDPKNIAAARQKSVWSRLDLWADDVCELELKEDVVGLGSYGKTLTVLFNNDLELDQDDEEREED